MNDLPHLEIIFDRLKRGYHLGPEDEPEFSALCGRPDDYMAYFAAIGLKLVRHEREFFYFEPDNPETVPDTLPRIAVFSYIMIDHAANQGRPIEEFIFGQNFLVTALPHFSLDRYTALLRQVELVWRWTDLRGKRQKFEQEHERKLEKLREDKASAELKVKELEAELAARRNDVADFSVEKGKLTHPLEDLKALDKEFAAFAEELERAALANLKKEINGLETQLASAEGESREKAKTKVTFFTDRVRDKEQTIRRFDQLVVTALRKNFGDDELNAIFRLLNRELLELPLGKDGVIVSRRDELIATLRGLLARIRNGVYSDAAIAVPLPQTGEPLTGLDNPDTAREQLADYKSTLDRWKNVLAAIEKREELEAQLNSKREQVHGKTGKNGEIITEGIERRLFR